MANMKMFSLLLVAALSQAAIVPSEWEQFKTAYGKSYSNVEEVYRKSLFMKNLKDIRNHNKLFMSGLESFSMAVNEFSDKHISEMVGQDQGSEGLPLSNLPEITSAPSEMDWRKQDGVVSRVKNQGSCGSCWAFSATGALEGQMKIKMNKTVTLSEQQLVDCDNACYGCRGGWAYKGYEYIKGAKGIEDEASYPYHARDGSCKYDASKAVGNCAGYEMLPSGETNLKAYVAKDGPMGVSIYATSKMMHYHGGILKDHTCPEGRHNHGVLVVGYGKDGDQEYFIVKNSWGSGWGESGYVRWAAGGSYANMCGVASWAHFPHAALPGQ